MPRFIPKPQNKIDDIDVYLETHRAEHYGNGIADFVDCLDRGLGNTEIGKKFGVSRDTARRWKILYERKHYGGN